MNTPLCRLAGPLAVIAAALTACTGSQPALVAEPAATSPAGDDRGDQLQTKDGPHGSVTLAFAGDVHFELHLAALLGDPQATFGPITRTLAAADLTMVNLEASISDGDTPDPKELEIASERYHFHTSPRALDFLAAAGVDVVTMGNNHGADYGHTGLVQTLRAIRTGPIPVLGVGSDKRAAFTPYRVSIRGTRFAIVAADGSPREGASAVWGATAETPGIAAARAARPLALLSAVREASERDDVVVVYLHWGTELEACPTWKQRATARALAEAGADIIVGSHAHVLLGSGWMGDTYVDYGLGNFLWYHNRQPDTGVLQIRIEDGAVVGDSWVPARIEPHGRPLPLGGKLRAAAIADWRQLRGCTGLDQRPVS